MKKERTKIKIIGMGRFGTLLKSILERNFTNIVFVQHISEADIVFPCVPISEFKSVIKKISAQLKKGSLVIDVCSVKVHPVNVMLRYLPIGIEIIASHPMFGPDSAKDDLNGLIVVLWPVRVNSRNFNSVVKSCERLGLKVVQISPEEHDRLVAFTQLYAHLVGRIGKKVNIKSTEIDTVGFKRMLSVQDIVANDSDQLFIDMNRFNPFAKAMRKKVIKSVKEIEDELR